MAKNKCKTSREYSEKKLPLPPINPVPHITNLFSSKIQYCITLKINAKCNP